MEPATEMWNNKAISQPADESPFGEITEDSFKKEVFLNDTGNLFKALLAVLPAGIAFLDGNHQIINYNPLFAKILGVSEEGLRNGAYTGRKYFRLDGTPMPREEFPGIRAEKEQRLIQSIVVGVEKEDGHLLWAEVCAAPLALGNARCLIITREITERLQDLESLRRSENKYRLLSSQLEAILDHIPGLIFYKDKKNKYIRVNKYVADAHQKEKAALEGVSLYDLYPTEQAEAYYRDDLAVLKEGSAKLNIEETWNTADGVRWVSTSKMPFVDEDGATVGIIGISMDITDRKRSEKLIGDLIRRLEIEKQQAETNALTDGLTGIANRRHFDVLLQGEMDRLRRSKSPLSLIMLDIDFFKKFNDRFGHVAGDSCLKSVARAIKESVGRSPDFVARYGGEEFVVVMPETKNKGAQIVAERIRTAVEKLTISHDGVGNTGQVTVSLGVATVYPGRTESYEKIVELADMALYRAKMGGRNRFEVAIHGNIPATPLEETPGFVELCWHEDFSCGNATIDDQHKNLFKTSSKLLSAISGGSDKAECLALIESLLEETRRHFQDEEEILNVNKYPLTGEHHQIHSGLLAKAAELSAKLTNNQLTIGELFTFLTNDIIWHHMYVEDRKFFPYL